MSHQGHASSPSHEAGRLNPDRRRTPRSEGALLDGFIRELRRHTPGRGEQRLALAVFEDAVRQVWRNRRWPRLRHLLPTNEAERWVASRDRDCLFSFENVCLILSVDPGEAREWILRRRARRSEPAVERPAFAARLGAERLRSLTSLRA